MRNKLSLLWYTLGKPGLYIGGGATVACRRYRVALEKIEEE